MPGLVACLLIASLGKSAQFPFSSWLPRAMEGPTPSSAIFYGAVSSHAGAYLLIRLSPWLDSFPTIRAAIVAIGLLTAAYCAFVGRARSDVKSQLAYAVAAQVGLIYAEIGLGFPRLALLHCLCHASLRTLQFIRAPSAVADFHRFHDLGARRSTGAADLRAPGTMRLRARIFYLALNEVSLPQLFDRGIVTPLLRLSRALLAFDRQLAGDGARRARAEPAGKIAVYRPNALVTHPGKPHRKAESNS